ncbi:MAG: hypothetical protein WC069_05045 [Candidatus Shapirobacteria bacterium]
MIENDISNLIKNNLMTREDLVKYLFDDLRVDLKKINSIKVYQQPNNKLKINLKKIPHHRYGLYFNELSGEMHIFPTEGVLRIEHLRIEAKVLEKLYTKKIKFSVYGKSLIEQNSKKVVNKINEHLLGSKIDGILIGSLWNFNFFTNLRIRPGFLSVFLADLDQDKIDKYVEYRIRLMIIEEELLSGKINLTKEEMEIFNEGILPEDKDYLNISNLSKKVKNINSILTTRHNDNDLTEYLTLDFLFYRDMHSNTGTFLKTMDFPETKIYKDNFLSFQLIKIGNLTFVNFSWANPTATAKVIELLQNKYEIKYFYMYGKCGSLSEKINTGDLVAPSTTENDNLRLNIHNTIKENIKKVDFCCVDSPLLETTDWLKEKKVNNIDCVEMELFPIVKILSPEVKKHIEFYVSDCPGRKYNLSNRFSFLYQRFSCVKNILNNISIETKHTNVIKKDSGLVGFPIQDIRQENQKLLNEAITGGVDFLHVDVSDGIVGSKSNIIKTKKLIDQIINFYPEISIQIHLFVFSREKLKSYLKSFNKYTKNTDIFLHVNRDNISLVDYDLLDELKIKFAVDVRDILDDRLPIKVLLRDKLIICLQSKEENGRISNFNIAQSKVRKVNQNIIITIDRSIDLEVIEGIQDKSSLNTICGSYLKTDFKQRCIILKSLLSQ